MRKILILCLSLCAGAAQAQPQPAGDDWPCPQRRTGTISAAAIWSGPNPAQAGPWADDNQAAELARKLASRRTPLAEVDAMLDDFAARAKFDKPRRLTHVFAGMLELINSERDNVLAGISRYAEGQNRLAEKVRAESDAVADAQEKEAQAKEAQDKEAQDKEAQDKEAAGNKDQANKQLTQKSQAAEESLKWDKRIFDERSRSLAYVCDTPVALERRAFDIARRIQQRL